MLKMAVLVPAVRCLLKSSQTPKAAQVPGAVQVSQVTKSDLIQAIDNLAGDIRVHRESQGSL